MHIWDILNQERDILYKLKKIITEEKQVLINNDSRALSILVEKKVELINHLDSIEQVRLSRYGKKKVSEIDIPDKYANKVQNLVKDIRNIHKEIQSDQEINMLLTNQSIDYNKNMMYIIQQAIAKSGKIYSDKGKMTGQSKTKSVIDQSV